MTSEKEDYTKSLYFNGTDEAKWPTFSFKMLAYAAKKGWKKAFLEKYDYPDARKDWDEDDEENYDLEVNAWSQLALAVDGHAMKRVMAVKSENPFEAWSKLMEEFEPTQITDVADLTMQFGTINLDLPSDNPIDWIENLEKNNERVGAIEKKYFKDDFLMITHVFAKLPKESYKTYVTTEKKGLATLTMEEVKKSILAYWKQYIKEDEKKEEAFYGEQQASRRPQGGNSNKKPFKRFKGTCNKCGKQGHKGVDCRGGGAAAAGRNPPSGTDLKHIKCYKCQENGHYARDCPNKKKEEFGLFCGMVSHEDPVEMEWTFTGIAEAIENAKDDASTGDTAWVNSKDVQKFNVDNEAIDAGSDSGLDSLDDVPALIKRGDDNSYDSSDDSCPDGLSGASSSCSGCDSMDDDSVDSFDDMPALLTRRHIGDDDTDDGVNEEVFDLSDEYSESHINKYLLDSGSTINADNDADSVKNPRPSNAKVTVANGNRVASAGVGPTTIIDDATGYPLFVKEMHVIPEFSKKIISLNKLSEEGYDVQFVKDGAIIRDKSGKEIMCPRDPNGLCYFHARAQDSCQAVTDEWKTVKGKIDPATGVDTGGTVSGLTKMPTKMELDHAHDVCGHKGEFLLRKTYKRIGVELTGKLTMCEGCGFAKAKAKAVSKTTSTKATKAGERLFLDTTGPFSPTLNGNKYWIQVVDDFTRHGFCEFNKNKKGMGEFIRKTVTKLRALGMETKYLRCDNAGEHLKDMVSLCDHFGMALELTAPDTPQMNGCVERRIVILKQRALAMMIAADLNPKYRELLWHEAVNCANDLENISANTGRESFPVEMMTGSVSKLYPKLQPFGRIGYVTLRQKFKKTWKEKSIKCIFVGYAKDHSADTYRMYNPATNAVIESRDITWAEWKRVDPKSNMSVFHKDPELLVDPMGLDDKEVPQPVVPSGVGFIPDNDYEAGRMKQGEQSKQGEQPVNADTSKSTSEAEAKAQKLARELRKLDTWKNPISKASNDKPTVLDTDSDGNEITKEVHFVFNTMLMTEHGDPTTFRKAIEGPDGDQWLHASGNEVMNFIKRGSWRKKLRSEVQEEGRKIIGTKWVYKKKDEQDGSVRYKGRIVSLGYMQIPGVDYTQSFSPVGNDSSVRIIIGLSLFYDEWTIEIIDIEAAFLEGEMERTMYIEWPAGIVQLGFITEEEKELYCIEQMKSMYGNSDAALIYFRLYKKHLIDTMGMIQSLTDPCVFYKKESDKVVLIAVCHVDDNAVCSSPEWIAWFKEGVKKRFGITDLGRLQKHLGIWYDWKVDENGERFVVATMPKLVRQIIETAEEAVGHEIKRSPVPGTPGVCLEKNPEGKETVMEPQYRSIVGKALYLVTKLFVEGSNPVRELAKYFSNPGDEHWKAIEKFVGYLKDNEDDIKLTYRKPRELRIVSSVDSNYATDKEDRRSVSGALHSLGGMMTSWLCKTQPNVSLSSCQAEYQSMAMALQEILFQQMLLKEIAYCVDPAIILEDNTGAIFLVKNQQVGARTKHIDVRWHFLRENHEKGVFEMKFTRSADNSSDICTKNTPERLLKKHSLPIRNGTMPSWMDYQTTVDTVSAVLRENVAFIESNEVDRIEVRRRSSNEFSLSITVADVGWTKDASLSLA